MIAVKMVFVTFLGESTHLGVASLRQCCIVIEIQVIEIRFMYFVFVFCLLNKSNLYFVIEIQFACILCI